MEKIKCLGCLIMFVLALGVVGAMEFEDHVAIERLKCESNGGTWIIENGGSNQYCKLCAKV